jgi:hypothetical protein
MSKDTTILQNPEFVAIPLIEDMLPTAHPVLTFTTTRKQLTQNDTTNFFYCVQTEKLHCVSKSHQTAAFIVFCFTSHPAQTDNCTVLAVWYRLVTKITWSYTYAPHSSNN